jgi:hypothetical protein
MTHTMTDTMIDTMTHLSAHCSGPWGVVDQRQLPEKGTRPARTQQRHVRLLLLVLVLVLLLVLLVLLLVLVLVLLLVLVLVLVLLLVLVLVVLVLVLVVLVLVLLVLVLVLLLVLLLLLLLLLLLPPLVSTFGNAATGLGTTDGQCLHLPFVHKVHRITHLPLPYYHPPSLHQHLQREREGGEREGGRAGRGKEGECVGREGEREREIESVHRMHYHHFPLHHHLGQPIMMHQLVEQLAGRLFHHGYTAKHPQHPVVGRVAGSE